MNDRTSNNYTEAQAKNRLLKEVNKPDNANLLTRLLAVPLSIGSVPDLIYHKDPLRYPKNIGKGVWTTLSGKDYTKNIKTGSDLLKQRDILQGDGIPENVANFLLSLGIDVVTDPLAFTKPVKALKLKDAAKVVKKVGLKGAKAKRLASLLTKEDVGNVGKILRKMGVDDAKEYGEKLAEEVSKKKATRKVVVGGFGKSKVLSESDNANTALDLLFNPVGTAIKGGAKVAQTVAPESTEKAIEKFNDLFVLGGNAKRKGLGKAAKQVKQNVQSSYEDKAAIIWRKLIQGLDLNEKEGRILARQIELSTELGKKSISKKKKAVEGMVEDLLKKSGREGVDKEELKELLTNALKEREVLQPTLELTEDQIKKRVSDSQLLRTINKLEDEELLNLEESPAFRKLFGILGGKSKLPKPISKAKTKLSRVVDGESIDRETERFLNKFDDNILSKEIPPREYAGNLSQDNLLSDAVDKLPGSDVLANKAGRLLEKYGVEPKDFPPVPSIVNEIKQQGRTVKDALETIKPSINHKTMKAAKAGSEEAKLSILKAVQKEVGQEFYKARGRLPQDQDDLLSNLREVVLKRIDSYDLEKYRTPTAKSFAKYIKGDLKKAVNTTIAESRALPKGLLDQDQKLNRAFKTLGIKDMDTITPKQWQTLEGLGFSQKRVEDIKQGLKPNLSFDETFMGNNADEMLDGLITETEKVDTRAAEMVNGIREILSDPVFGKEKSPIGFGGMEELRRKYAKDVSKIDFTKVGKNAEETAEIQKEAKKQLFAKVVHALREKNAFELDNIIKNFKFDDGKKAFSIEPVKGWVRVPHLDGYVHPDGADMLKHFYKSFNPKVETNDFVKLYDGLINKWKMIVTSYSPWVAGYSVRNAIGDMMNMLIGGYADGNPIQAVRGLEEGAKFMGMLKHISEVGLESAEKKYGKQKIRAFNEAFDRGVFSGKFNQVAEDIGYKVKGEALYPKEGFWKKHVVGRLEWRENWFRMSNLLDAYRRTNNWEKAAELAKRTSLDFSNLTTFERRKMKRLLPFYGFLRANLEHQLHAYHNNPYRLIFQERVFDNIKNLFAGKKLTKEEWDNIPDWMKNGITLPISKDENGTYRVMTNFGEPTHVYNNLIDLSSPEAFISNIISGVNPIVKFPIEMIYNYSTFRDDKVSNLVRGSYYKNFPKPIKDLLEYSSGTITDKYGRKVSSTVVNPERAYVMSNAPFISPFVVQAKNLLDYKDQGNDALLNLSGILGGKIRKRNTFADRRSADKDVEDLIQQLISQ